MSKLIDSPEWQYFRKQHEEAGRPKGAHIREKPDPDFEIAAAHDAGLHHEDNEDQIRAFIQSLKNDSSRSNPPPAPRWTKGEIISAIGLVVILVGSVIGVVGWGISQQSGVYASMNSQRDSLEKEIKAVVDAQNAQNNTFNHDLIVIQDTMKTLVQVVRDDETASKDRATLYIPKIEGLLSSNALLTDRVQTMAQSAIESRENGNRADVDIRARLDDLQKSVGTLGADVQVLKAQRLPGPR